LSRREIDDDLLEVTISRLQQFYARRKYSVAEVVQWYLDRIHRYNGIYRAVEAVLGADALRMAARADSDSRPLGARGPLWGVPIVIKANTSIRGQVTTDGWAGFTRAGHELIASRDATIVAKLRAAGAIMVGHTNMPDFAASDTTRSSSFGRTGNAYDVRFSPGGSSGGTVTAVTANLALLGTGTDTGNSIRMPAATSALVGVLPTRGLVSLAGIAPLDWLLDDTGPIARDVTDAAIALSVMAGEDPLDPATAHRPVSVKPEDYVRSLKSATLKGKRFAVPSFILKGEGMPFHGIPPEVPHQLASKRRAEAGVPLRSETRAAFMRDVATLRALGATIVFDDSVLPDSFTRLAAQVCTYAYVREGTNRFLRNFGPAQYHSIQDYERSVGQPVAATITGAEPEFARIGDYKISQVAIEDDPSAKADYFAPRERMLTAYLEPLQRLHLDGYVYPPIQMPPPDETMPQDGRISEGPHSLTSFANVIGVPAVVVVGGFYPDGLPYGLEFSGRPWRDGDLLGWAYAWEQATHYRHPPTLVAAGLLSDTPKNNSESP
jgi:Asp-tRNA(Asn)/Glu-tRNA(Gln) amidotransferase A subunit family amidase